ncbi:MAG TPA: hypothetical protein EYP85_02990, partial [Armatimonadetes bacterium]|nr:hypothetical protein [Armatimonadota bacterium]
PQALDTALSATQQAANAFYALQPSRRPELRAAWIHSAYGVPGWGWEKTIRVLAENGFNAIFPNMLWGGVAHYPSRYLPIAQTATYDQIAECLYWCRKYGLELHVWKVNYNLGPAPEEFVQKLRAEGRLQADREGNEIKWLSPSHPDNFALERDAMLEVVRNYNVDGIHFDYIRYPHANADYSEGARQRFEKETGVKVQNWPEEVITGPYRQIFARWRREQITKLVAAVSKEARKIRPRIKISAAVFADWADSRESIGQDTRLWIERGYLDFVCPMDYTPNNDRLVRWVQRQAGWVAGRVPLYIGIGAFRHPDPVRTVEQINLARQYGADGFVIFQHSSQFGERFLPALHRGVTAVAARPTHLAARVKFHLPPGLPEYGGRWYLEGKPITVSVELERTPVREERWAYVRGAVELRAPNDEPILNFGQLRLLVGERKELHLTLPAGRFRLAFAGRGRRRGSWEYEPILVRGPMVTTITRSVYEAEQAKYRPPRGKGIKVGIWPRGYGSGGIYRALQRVRGVRPFLLRTLDEETLRQCEVLILAQPRPGRGPRGEWVAALRAFVEQGGGLLVTHDAVGFRDLPAILPEIAQGAAREETKQWRIAQEHAITAGLALDQTYEHTYYDHIVLQAGEKGTVLVGSAEKPLVIIGEWGRGRYVACGLALGLDPRDRDVEPSEAELALLVHAVEWLGRAEERERKRQRPWPL